MSMTKKEQRLRRSRQTRLRIALQGTARLAVHRTNLHIYANVLSGDGAIKGVPLFRADPAAWVGRLNAISRSHGVAFVLAKPVAEAAPAADA